MDKLDIKLWTLEAKGHIVPDRSLLKTPQQKSMAAFQLRLDMKDFLRAYVLRSTM